MVSQPPVETTNDQTVTLRVRAQWVWSALITPAQQLAWVRHLQGERASDALTWMKQQPGVARVTIRGATGGTPLPRTANQITLVIVPTVGMHAYCCSPQMEAVSILKVMMGHVEG